MPPDTFWILPSWKVKKIRAIEVEFEFSKRCLYNFGDDPDQRDWNKLAGLTFHPFKRDQNAVLIGWRSNPQVGMLEVTAYSNINGGRYIGWGQDQRMMYIQPEQKGKVVIEPDGLKWDFSFYKEGKVMNRTQHTQIDKFKRGYKVGNWFGGFDNDGNGLGGKAPNTFWINYSFKVLT